MVRWAQVSLLFADNFLAVKVFLDSFGKVIPLYLSLTFVPVMLMQTSRVFKDPIGMLVKGVLSAARSTTFLAAFVALYMFFISAHRRLLGIG
jgi:hypothetical protein